MKKRLLSVALIATMLVGGCSSGGKVATPTGEGSSSGTGTTATEESKTPGQSVSLSAGTGEIITVADIKKTYGMTDTLQIKPFYNVAQDTKFIFNFKSDVEPCHAITVHTDSKCELDSMVYQLNDGYQQSTGRTVVVKPGRPVLDCPERNGNLTDNYNWGNAPIYYLCIRYDLEASTPTKLVTPIIVPFTVKSDVSVPTVQAGVDTDGTFYITWNAVDGAVSYNIYEATRVREESKAYNLTRAEAGYVGDHLTKLATVDSNTLRFTDFHNDGQDNILKSADGNYIMSQNYYDLGSYYVTAVDSSGKESFMSFPVTGWQYGASQPRKIDEYKVFGVGNLTYLPESVPVEMADKSTAYFPVNYKKKSVDYGVATYEYAIQGTKLTGTVKLESASGLYDEEIISSASVPTYLYEVKNDVQIVPANNVKTIIEDGNSKEMTLSGEVNINAPKLETDYDARLKRADLENVRIVTDGVYSENIFNAIPTYLTGTTASEGVSETSAATEETATVAETTTTEETTTAQETTIAMETTTAPETTVAESTVESVSETQVETIPEEETNAPAPTEGTQDDIVSEQIESTNRQVEEGNNVEVESKGYPVFAGSAEEAYVAMSMINGQELIDVSMFPSLQNGEYLIDVVEKVVYQNPYVISPSRFGYSPEYQVLAVEYALPQNDIVTRQEAIYKKVDEIGNSIFKDGMSDEEKVRAIWDYLEANTKYDDAALEAAEASNFTEVLGFEDSFNAYGILCKGVGVCQSYSYAYHLLCEEAGVNCVSLIGFLNRTLPHAWNAVQLGGNWYWLDATNNANVIGFPDYLYQTSSDFAMFVDYVLDESWALDSELDVCMSTDNSKDPYFVNGLAASSNEELAEILGKNFKSANKGDTVVVKCNYVVDYESEVVGRTLIEGLIRNGVSEDDIVNARIGYIGGYFLMIKE